MAEEKVRQALLLRTVLEILRDTERELSPGEVLSEVSERVELNAFELSPTKSGPARWETSIWFRSGDAATEGWMTKRGGWSITEAGLEALESYANAEELDAELQRLWYERYRRRKEAQQNLAEWQRFIDDAIGVVPPGSWTTYVDLATLVGATEDEVAHFLAATKVIHSYRVLTSDGAIPPEGMVHAHNRSSDLYRRLTEEGINFGSNGRADQSQRLDANGLKERLEARTEQMEGASAPAQRAWRYGDQAWRARTSCRTGSTKASCRSAPHSFVA